MVPEFLRLMRLLPLHRPVPPPANAHALFDEASIHLDSVSVQFCAKERVQKLTIRLAAAVSPADFNFSASSNSAVFSLKRLQYGHVSLAQRVLNLS